MSILLTEPKYFITLKTIKKTCGWEAYCKETGVDGNKINEYGVSDSMVFGITESQGKKLKIIK